MNIKAKFKLTKEYFREDLQQWIKYISKGRKYEPLLCTIFIIVGAMLILVNMTFKIASIFFIGIGGYESIRYILWKRNWLKARMHSPQYNQEIELIFSEQGIKQTIPHDEPMKEYRLLKYISTQKGIFLYFEKSSHIYVPNDAFENLDEKNKVLTILKPS
jgi:hypothetical protein